LAITRHTHIRSSHH